MFDTLRYSKALEATGISRDQAEAHVRIIAEILEGELATKQDIQQLRNEDIRELKNDFVQLRNDLVHLESRLVIKLGALTAGIVTFAIAVTAAIAKLI